MYCDLINPNVFTADWTAGQGNLQVFIQLQNCICS